MSAGVDFVDSDVHYPDCAPSYAAALAYIADGGVPRDAGGARSTTLPDFYIGAHAAVEGMTLLTRDPARFRTYLPTLALIAPDA